MTDDEFYRLLGKAERSVKKAMHRMDLGDRRLFAFLLKDTVNRRVSKP